MLAIYSGSNAVTLVSLYVPLVNQKNKQNNVKMNENTA